MINDFGAMSGNGLKAQFNYPECGTDADIDWAKNVGLAKGMMYDVESVDMSQSVTYIKITGYKNPFNSIQFDFFEDGKPLDIYRDTLIQRPGGVVFKITE